MTFFCLEENGDTIPRTLFQWDAVNGAPTVSVPVDSRNLTAHETRQLDTWKLWAAKAYAEITLRVENDYGEVIVTITNPRAELDNAGKESWRARNNPAHDL